MRVSGYGNILVVGCECLLDDALICLLSSVYELFILFFSSRSVL